MKIRKKLILSYLAACVIPLVISCLAIYWVSVENLQDSSYELASIFSSQIVTEMDDFLDDYNGVTKTVLVDNDILYGLDKTTAPTVLEKVNHQLYMRRIMLRIVTLKPDIKNICFIADEGEFYQYNHEGSYIDRVTLENQEWLALMQASKDTLVISAVHDRRYCDRNEDGIVFTVGRRIYDYGGSSIGMLLIDLEPSSLFKLSDAFLLARNQYNMKISITDAHDGLLYDSDVASGRITWADAASEGNLLLYQKHSQDYIVLTEQTKRAELKVSVVIPKAGLLLKTSKIGYVTALAIICCIIVIIATSFFFSKRITHPIGMLQKRMRQIESGEYKELIEMDTDDEIGALVGSYNRMVTTIKTLIEDVFIAEIKQKNARYLALKNQINPHMLYNTLESIRLKALLQGADDVSDMIKILAKMFRMSLSDVTKIHRIREEVEYAQSYIQLQNMRFHNLFFLDVELDEKMLDASIITMVLQPIIENSIEHGMHGRDIPLHIVIRGELCDDGNLKIQVCDDGRGMLPERIHEVNNMLTAAETDKLKLSQKDEEGKTGIGLKNIMERLALYYANASYLRVVKSGPDGTIIEISIPSQWDERHRRAMHAVSRTGCG